MGECAGETGALSPADENGERQLLRRLTGQHVSLLWASKYGLRGKEPELCHLLLTAALLTRATRWSQLQPVTNRWRKPCIAHLHTAVRWLKLSPVYLLVHLSVHILPQPRGPAWPCALYSWAHLYLTTSAIPLPPGRPLDFTMVSNPSAAHTHAHVCTHALPHAPLHAHGS